MSPSPETRPSLLVRLVDRDDRAAWPPNSRKSTRRSSRGSPFAAACSPPMPTILRSKCSRRFPSDRPLAARSGPREIPHLADADRAQRNRQRAHPRRARSRRGRHGNATPFAPGCRWRRTNQRSRATRNCAAKSSVGPPIKLSRNSAQPPGTRSGSRQLKIKIPKPSPPASAFPPARSTPPAAASCAG